MEQPSAVKILFAGPPGPASATARAAVEALRGLGPEARIESLSDAEECLTRCRSGEVDLVVCERGADAPGVAILEALRDSGPPVVVVADESGDEVALEAFRRGAADCVAVGPEFRDVLALVALEQIRRWRAIRERVAAERRIRDLERTNENIIQNMNSAMLVVDPDGRIASANPPAEQILTGGSASLRGKPAWNWFRRPDGEDSLLARTLRGGERFKGAESAITRDDGSVIPIGISCAPLLDSEGQPRGAVAIFTDLSEITQLRRKVLQTEKMASIGQLAAGVAHEINNPMGFIHANLFQMAEYVADLRKVWDNVDAVQGHVDRGEFDQAQVASQRLRALSADADVEFLLSDLAKAIRESQEGSERIRHIVQDLRDFSHHDTAERVPADVNHCLETTASIVWPMMKHLVVLEKDYGDLPSVDCFPMQLKQVFMNLLVNAFQAIEERLEQTGGTGHIQLRTERRDAAVVVTVSDDGLGIPRENLDRIFDPFFTTKKVGSGTGLGLSTSYNIIERHGGSIAVESKPGEGTTFEVSLPIPFADGSDAG